MWPNLPYNSLGVQLGDIVVIAGMLTGGPKEEVSGSSSDLLHGMAQLHEQAR